MHTKSNCFGWSSVFSAQSKTLKISFWYRSETTETNVLFRIVPKLVPFQFWLFWIETSFEGQPNCTVYSNAEETFLVAGTMEGGRELGPPLLLIPSELNNIRYCICQIRLEIESVNSIYESNGGRTYDSTVKACFIGPCPAFMTLEGENYIL